jgi:hypothetical protein
LSSGSGYREPVQSSSYLAELVLEELEPFRLLGVCLKAV